MLPRDIETREALAHLSERADDSPRGLSRRRFLQAVAFGAGGVLAGPGLGLTGLPGLPGFEDDMAAADPLGANEGVLVVITLAGGNDALNTVVPHGQPMYYTRRGSLAYPANVCWGLGPGVGLTPNLVKLKTRFSAGKVAVIQGIGIQEASDFSHFDSMAKWMHGWSPGGPPTTGWLGRWMDGLATANPFAGVSIGSDVPLHLVGANRKALALGTGGAPFGGRSDASWNLMYKGISDFGAQPTGLGTWGDAIAQSGRQLIQTSTQANALYSTSLGSGPIGNKLTLAARLINANLGVRVIGITMGDFDSHKNQPGMHPQRMKDLDAGIETFFTGLLPAFSGRTAMLVVSEFGRTPTRNDSNGFDHGWAGNGFLIGDRVAGGLKGETLNITTLESNNHIRPTISFRSVYSEILTTWLAGDATQILGANIAPTPLFAAGPS